MAEITFRVGCSKCGAELTAQTSFNERRGFVALDVEPCEQCGGERYDEGRDEGRDEGYNEAMAEKEGGQ